MKSTFVGPESPSDSARECQRRPLRKLDKARFGLKEPRLFPDVFKGSNARLRSDNVCEVKLAELGQTFSFRC